MRKCFGLTLIFIIKFYQTKNSEMQNNGKKINFNKKTASGKKILKGIEKKKKVTKLYRF